MTFVFQYLQKMNKTYVALVAFAVLVAVFYGNTLDNGFVLDDYPVLVDNLYIQSLDYASKIVTGCIGEFSLDGCAGQTLHYRPIHSLSYLITYQISSQPWFFSSCQFDVFFCGSLSGLCFDKTSHQKLLSSIYHSPHFSYTSREQRGGELDF